MAFIIQSGTIITSKKTFQSDIRIEKGTITKIAGKITPKPEDKILDAAGKFIFPGAIDPHVHMHLPVFAGYSVDDFYTGSKAAIHGGTTTLIDFVTPQKGEPLPAALEKRKKEAENCLCDYSFHVSPIEWRKSLPDEITETIQQGCTSFKVYMAYKQSIGLEDEDLYQVMQSVAKQGALLTVHAEMGDDIENLRNEFATVGKTAPKYHPLSRPAETEAQAVKKVLQYVEETACPVYIVHVSTAKSLEYIAAAQQKGLKVFAETCPHYLLLDDSRYEGDFEQSAPFVLSPPLRKKEDKENLWLALQKGIIQSTGTDHCPFTMEMKRKGIDDFRYIPNGAGGVEHRLALLYTYGVLQNKISINQFVDIVATQPAKIFGLYPQKGEIAEGSDADIVIWNPEKEQIISAKNHHQNCDNNIFEGFKTRGMPEHVIINGEIILLSGDLINERTGKFIKRRLNI